MAYRNVLIPVLIFLVLAASRWSVQAADAAPRLELQEFTPAAMDEALVNPGTGLYLYGTRSEADVNPNAWYYKLVNIGYFRDDWSVLEPDAEGQYKFEEYFGPIFDLWVKKWHKRVSFRFMSQNMHSQRKYVTPKWVFDKGITGYSHKGIYIPEQIDPPFWDEQYLAIQEKFIADLGKYLDGRPGVEFIDIGGIGQWGEMHLMLWTPEQLQASGYTETKYIGAYRRLIDAYVRAFPHTRIFLNVGDYACINDYAALHGVHFRQDGLNPSGPSAKVGDRFYRPYSRERVICNYELFDNYKDMLKKGWGVGATFKRGLEDPISYFHINLMGWRELANAPDEVKAAVTDAARRIGFRFVLTQLKCNKTLHVSADEKRSSRLLIEHHWKNTGVAPCYDSYALRWSLADAKGKVVAQQLDFPLVPTTRWWQNEEITLNSMFRIPAGVPAGTYRLKVAMVKPEDPAVAVQLAIGGAADGDYDLCEISAAAPEEHANPLFTEDFESGESAWSTSEGMSAKIDADAHAGKHALLVGGAEAGKSWNYAARRGLPLLPASRYRFSCWMKVDSISDPTLPPYVKVGVNDAANKWLTNCNSSKYDVTRLGTWQALSGIVETGATAATGSFAIEKGVLEAKVEAVIHLDDVELELLESP